MDIGQSFETEKEIVAKPRNVRRRAPTVVFGEDRCAVGWAYLVPDGFRQALDIVYTVRKKGALWTEGSPPAYAFRDLDSLPSREVVPATQDLNVRRLVVNDAEPDRVEARRIVAGYVDFRVIEWDGAEYVERFSRRVTQAEFAEILRTGSF